MARLQRRALTGTTLVVLAIIFVALVVLSGALLRGARLDLTENRLYTLTDGTLAILDKLEEPVNLYFFYSEEAAEAVPRDRHNREAIAIQGPERAPAILLVDGPVAPPVRLFAPGESAESAGAQGERAGAG